MFLLVLGIVMALISFVLDLAIDKCQTGVLRYINFYLLCILCILFFFFVLALLRQQVFKTGVM